MKHESTSRTCPFPWPEETRRIIEHLSGIAPNGIWSTGVENADPWVNGVRRNQLRECFDFYQNYPLRLENIRSLGIPWLRFGEGFSLAYKGPGEYDFALTDRVVEKCGELGITLIADLLHFGLPEALHADVPDSPFFQNPHFPERFAQYAAAYARRYPQIRYFDLVNETYPVAEWSAAIGIMNEHRKDVASHVRAMKNVAKAVILAREAISKVWQEEGRAGEPLFFQNESMGKQFAAPGTDSEREVEHFNTVLRFVPLDLILGNPDERVRAFLLANGCSPEEYEWFMERGSNRRGFVLGIDHYPGCITTRGGEEVTYGDHTEPFRFEEVIKEYGERYRTPLYHMEYNGLPEFGERIFRLTYEGVAQLLEEGYPLVPGLTWYGDEYLCGWDTFLTGDNIIEVGLFHEGKKQPIADAYLELMTRGLPEPLRQPGKAA